MTNEPEPPDGMRLLPKRQFTESEWIALEQQFSRGTRVAGTVIVRCAFGVWVRVDQFPEVKALLEVIEFADPNDPDQRFSDPADYPDVGSRVEAVVSWWKNNPNSSGWQEVYLTQRPLRELTP